jgi:hypothetical protein
MSKSMYTSGETAAILLEINNASAAEVHNLSVRFKRQLRLKTRGAMNSFQHYDTLFASDFPGIGPNQQVGSLIGRWSFTHWTACAKPGSAFCDPQRVLREPASWIRLG